MTLRTRLFLFLSGLILLLVSAEWVLVTALTNDLEDEVGQVALEVGSGVLSMFMPRVVSAEVPATEGSLSRPGKQRIVDALAHDGQGGSFTYAVNLDDASPGIFGTRSRLRLERRERDPQRDEEIEFEQFLELERLEIPRHFRDLAKRWTPPPEESQASNRTVLRIVMHTSADQVVVATGDRPFGLGGAILVGPDDLDFFEPNIHELEARVAELRAHVKGALTFELGLAQVEFFELHDDHDVEMLFEDHNVSFFAPRRTQVSAGVFLAEAPGETAPAPASLAAGELQAAAPTTLAATALQTDPVTHEIPIPHTGFDGAVQTFLRRLWLGTFVIFGLGLLTAGWIAHRVSVPLRELSRAAREVGEGALGTQVAAVGDRELAETVAAFNHMSTRLAELDAEARTLRDGEHLTEIGEVARGLAHAMRNPLHLLGLSVEALAAHSTEPQTELVDSARGQIQRIDRSLRSFLTLSSGGGCEEEISVDDLARDVALEILQDPSLSARVRVEACGNCRLLAVGPELRSVLQVLVVNAVEASPAGKEVLVTVTCAGRRVRMEVLDEGSGLPPSVAERLFTPHVTTKQHGAGMGLYLAHRIATSRYGGTLSLTPRETGGTRAVLEVTDRGGIRG
ncbi:MAG: HAMP domain-containing sensor histidine kinase [Planctomycetota bacterium]